VQDQEIKQSLFADDATFFNNGSLESFENLRITFYNDINKTSKFNTDKKINEFKNVIKQWMHRKFTSMGRVTVIKTVAIPKLIYPFTVFENPNIKICNNLTTEIFKFIWDNKPDKIKRYILYSISKI